MQIVGLAVPPVSQHLHIAEQLLNVLVCLTQGRFHVFCRRLGLCRVGTSLQATGL